MIFRHRISILLSLLTVITVTTPTVCADSGDSAVQRQKATSGLDNQSLQDWIRGVYRNETMDQLEWRGDEQFELWLHPDGSRTLEVMTNLAARSALFSLSLYSDANFVPREAFVRYWNQGVYKGSGHFFPIGNQLRQRSNGPAGQHESTLSLPDTWTLGAHPVSADGWHTARYDLRAASPQRVNLLSVNASADLTKPVLASWTSLQIEYFGPEPVDVPAGCFVADRYKLAGVNDLWVSGPHRLVIKSEIPLRNLRYVLTKFESARGDAVLNICNEGPSSSSGRVSSHLSPSF